MVELPEVGRIIQNVPVPSACSRPRPADFKVVELVNLKGTGKDLSPKARKHQKHQTMSAHHIKSFYASTARDRFLSQRIPYTKR